MSRSWLAFGVGVMLLVSPLRLVWGGPGGSPWAAFGIAGVLVLLGAWASRGRE